MTFSINLSRDDVFKAYLLNNKKPIWLQLPIYLSSFLMFILFIYYSYLLYLGYKIVLVPDLILGGLLIYSLINRYIFFPRTVHKYFDSSNELKYPMNIEITEERVVFNSEFENQSRKWDHLFGWKENDKFLLLYITNLSWHIIPKFIFTDPNDYNLIKRKIDEKGIKRIHYPPRSIEISIIYLFLLVGIMYLLFEIF